MSDIRIAEDLWATRLMPEGLLAAWRVEDGAQVADGQPVAEVEIEGARHEIVSPATGRLVQAWTAGSVIEPGSVIGRVRQ